MSKKRGLLGILIIGGVALAALLALFFVAPSCAGAESGDGAGDPPPPPPPTADPRVEALEATAQAAVAATVAAATSLTPQDVEATVAAALAGREAGATLAPDRRSRLFVPEEDAGAPAATSVAVSLLFGPDPVFDAGWEGSYGPLGRCAGPGERFALPCPDGWTPVSEGYSLFYVEPGGLAWLSAAWISAEAGVTAELGRAGLPAEAEDWRAYEFFGWSAATSQAGRNGIRLDYGRQVVRERCAERVSEVWYEVGELVYLVAYGYCRDNWMELGGYQDAAVLGVTFRDPEP